MKFFLCRSRNSDNLATIHAEFQRMKDIPEIKLADDITAFLEDLLSTTQQWEIALSFFVSS
ncbi:uncharacterized protein ATNIH1004_009396 [Aspergillus tanneri]|uniref:Uncharacterized protein n=1 Tax=Aspergillus tanneri TaxID=1220188 RepID=A0A5M9ML64_9EURO|nr:uncharacterized protein ATNIH1004_009396 [Aspergillus tanneri]KAA8645179.1 hypothetical protein ATNIH1004_009396 [Aspergillus tanneri]